MCITFVAVGSTGSTCVKKENTRLNQCAYIMHLRVGTAHLLDANACACISICLGVYLRAGSNPRSEGAVEQHRVDVSALPLGGLGLLVVVIVIAVACPIINGVGGQWFRPHAWPVLPQRQGRLFSLSFWTSHLTHHVLRGRNVLLALLFAFSFSFCPAQGGGRLNLGGTCCGGFFFSKIVGGALVARGKQRTVHHPATN